MNFKHLAFYGGAIGVVVALFTLTTNYGEANLRAPIKIEGRYRIAAQDLPGCLKDNALVLTLQQSGIYLNGSLSNDETSKIVTTAREKPSLSGTWEPPKLELSGVPAQLKACQKEGRSRVTIEGTTAQGDIQGKIRLDSAPAATFVAKREAGQ